MPKRATRKGVTLAKQRPKRLRSDRTVPPGKRPDQLKPPEKDPGGRPTKYMKEFAGQAEKLCLLGATDAELADFFGVTETTINNWKGQHEEFFESIKRGKLTADAEIADSLFQRAKGYTHPELYISTYKGDIVTHETRKHYPPDTAAAFIWLKNRQPDKWRDKVQHVGGNPADGDQPIQVSHELPPEVKEAMARVSLRAKAVAAGSKR